MTDYYSITVHLIICQRKILIITLVLLASAQAYKTLLPDYGLMFNILFYFWNAYIWMFVCRRIHSRTPIHNKTSTDSMVEFVSFSLVADILLTAIISKSNHAACAQIGTYCFFALVQSNRFSKYLAVRFLTTYQWIGHIFIGFLPSAWNNSCGSVVCLS